MAQERTVVFAVDLTPVVVPLITTNWSSTSNESPYRNDKVTSTLCGEWEGADDGEFASLTKAAHLPRLSIAQLFSLEPYQATSTERISFGKAP